MNYSARPPSEKGTGESWVTWRVPVAPSMAVAHYIPARADGRLVRLLVLFGVVLVIYRAPSWGQSPAWQSGSCPGTPGRLLCCGVTRAWPSGFRTLLPLPIHRHHLCLLSGTAHPEVLTKARAAVLWVTFDPPRAKGEEFPLSSLPVSVERLRIPQNSWLPPHPPQFFQGHRAFPGRFSGPWARTCLWRGYVRTHAERDVHDA